MGERKNNNRVIGTEQEHVAAEYLKQSGYEIVCQNFYSPFGEVDLIAKEGEVLVFCEVKYRATTGFGYPVEAVSKGKLTKIKKTAQYFCLKNQIPEDCPKRFDVISILGEEIRLYQNITGF